MKKLLITLMIAGLMSLGAATVSAQTSTAPKSVIHVVTVSWKAGTTPEQIKAALDGAQALPAMSARSCDRSSRAPRAPAFARLSGGAT